MADADLLVALGFAAVTRAIALVIAVVLLWLHPRTQAKRFLAIGLVLWSLIGVFDLGFVLDFPGGPSRWFFPGLILAYIARLYILAFLAVYPTPVKLRSPMGVAHASTVALSFLAAVVFVATEGDRSPTIDRLVGYYDPAYNTVFAAALLLSLERTRRLPDDEKRDARRLVAATGATVFVFSGYAVLSETFWALGIPHHLRYGENTLSNTHAWTWWLGTVVLLWALSLFILIRHRERLVLGAAALGACAMLLDGSSQYNIIDFGVINLIVPLVALRAATRHGAFGVKKVPARVGVAVSALTGLSVCVLVAAVFTLVAADQPFFLILGSLTGLIAGAIVAYQVRPRGVGIAVYRHPEGSTPARALTGTQAAPGALIAGRYRVDRVLGEGGGGHAFLARDEVLHRDVVLKSLSTGGQAAVREARLVAMLAHRNVVQVFDVLETSAETLLVLEYAPGGSLRGLLQKRKPLARDEAAAFLGDILDGLAAAHEAGIVHGDVKPENVLLDAEGRAKLADFGSASVPRADATMRQAATGTLLYMSPEQARGEPPTRRSDLYAAALCYHEMLVGAPLWGAKGLDDLQLRTLIATGEPTLGTDDAALTAFLRRALARDPAARFEGAAQMREALAGANVSARRA